MVAYVIGYVLIVVVLFLLFRKIILWVLEKFLPPEYTEPSLEEKQGELNYLKVQLRSLDEEVTVTEELVDIDEELSVLRERLKKAEEKRFNKGE